MEVTDNELAIFLPRVKRVAGSVRTSVPFDDLVQEGMILVWQCLQQGRRPSMKIIKFRLIDYARTDRSVLAEKEG